LQDGGLRFLRRYLFLMFNFSQNTLVTSRE